ncbi:MAG TPA: hypothetical protein VMY37_28525 [Thermoguttaceae bacterium]|nr:hypothetical protein [Thermoguttaceae bacterium]
MRRCLAGLITGAALGAAIWLASPIVTGQHEPWDGSCVYFAASLFAAGLLSGFVAGKWVWSVPFALYFGQMAVMFLRPQPGATETAPFWAAATLLAAYTLWVVAGAALAFALPIVLDRVRRRRGQFSVRTLLLATSVIALALGLAFYLPVRLSWRFGKANQRLTSVQPVAVRPMPETPVPEGWVRCRFGPLQFDVPPELAKEVRASSGRSPAICLYEDTDTSLRRVGISLPTDLMDDLSSRLARDNLSRADVAVPARGSGLSLIRLRLACYQASWDDFRWTMTEDEFRWHTWRVRMSRYLRSFGSDGWVETIFRDDLEGLVHLRPNPSRDPRYVGSQASFQWQASGGNVGGHISFTELTAKPDPGWVRAVCQSLKYSGEPFPECATEDQVLALFKVAE